MTAILSTTNSARWAINITSQPRSENKQEGAQGHRHPTGGESGRFHVPRSCITSARSPDKFSCADMVRPASAVVEKKRYHTQGNVHRGRHNHIPARSQLSSPDSSSLVLCSCPISAACLQRETGRVMGDE
ncbi:unnamed protein product [Ectocarpus sp. 6 AP-2014]